MHIISNHYMYISYLKCKPTSTAIMTDKTDNCPCWEIHCFVRDDGFKQAGRGSVTTCACLSQRSKTVHHYNIP